MILLIYRKYFMNISILKIVKKIKGKNIAWFRLFSEKSRAMSQLERAKQAVKYLSISSFSQKMNTRRN